MNKLFLIFFSLFLIGCAVTTKPSLRPLTDVSDVMLGASKQAVKSVMGGEVVVGYEKSDNASGTFVPLTLKNPVRVEYMESAGKKYEVEYYFTQVKQADGNITDDELTPLVFDNGTLAGKDWAFLNNLKKLSR